MPGLPQRRTLRFTATRANSRARCRRTHIPKQKVLTWRSARFWVQMRGVGRGTTSQSCSSDSMASLPDGNVLRKGRGAGSSGLLHRYVVSVDLRVAHCFHCRGLRVCSHPVSRSSRCVRSQCAFLLSSTVRLSPPVLVLLGPRVLRQVRNSPRNATS